MCRRAHRDRHRARRNSAFRLARRTIAKAGERLSPSQVKRRGMTDPSANALDASSICFLLQAAGDIDSGLTSSSDGSPQRISIVARPRSRNRTMGRKSVPARAGLCSMLIWRRKRAAILTPFAKMRGRFAAGKLPAMRPLLHPSLVNGRYGDPTVYVETLFVKRGLLFDIGEIASLSPRKIQRVDQIFLSHAHIDHFVGFDHLLRLLVGREKSVHLYGPSGIAERVHHKLQGYHWNLV